MKKSVTLNELIATANEAIKPIGHSTSTLYQYNLGWNVFRKFSELHGENDYSETLALRFIEEARQHFDNNTMKEWRYKLYRLSVIILDEVHKTGTYRWSFHRTNPDANLSEKHRLIQEGFEAKLRQLGKASATIGLYCTVSRQFFRYIQSTLSKDLRELKLSDVSRFTPYIGQFYQSTSMRTVLSALRALLKYLSKERLLAIDLLPAVPSSCARKYSVVPALSLDEEDTVLSSIDKSCCLGRRDYAIILLAMRTGLREIDIVNLRLSQIDRHRNELLVIQHKTGSPLVLPLLVEVGNAIADYILHGRPESTEPYVFLKHSIPYGKLGSGYGVNSRALRKASIRQEVGQSKGLHIYRHSVATRMLSEEVPLFVISDALGHRTEASTRSYLSADSRHLKACALTLQGIETTKEELQ